MHPVQTTLEATQRIKNLNGRKVIVEMLDRAEEFTLGHVKGVVAGATTHSRIGAFGKMITRQSFVVIPEAFRRNETEEWDTTLAGLFGEVFYDEYDYATREDYEDHGGNVSFDFRFDGRRVLVSEFHVEVI